ncbi:hypothetical protein Nizo2259_1867 [Lactiplantibacillus plantarum]|nr:hypothetical protein N654_2619 [Lactiplantibacillus plantarum 4_3]KEZ12938.1 hypothetical protein Lp90_2500 [Lactiplantibacillus plantarum]KZT95339.1 hypothetical protein Nizo2259_1867 [Lactiplantibacillus plantarum]MCT0223510.1 hypothetical protein [Lactiplantibacillus plantarum]QAA29368.1 hypothetical protein C0682_12265 [Lactiplantibacillus plantarum]
MTAYPNELLLPLFHDRILNQAVTPVLYKLLFLLIRQLVFLLIGNQGKQVIELKAVNTTTPHRT